MLSALPAAQAAAFRKSLKPLLSSNSNSTTKKSILQTPGALPAPLELRHQAKLNRQAAKEKLDTELATWQDTIASVRGIGSRQSEFGDHRISLPLAHAGSATSNLSAPIKKVDQTTAEWGSKFLPSSLMEKEILGVLSTTGLENATTTSKLEAKELSKLSAQDQQARVNALREQRELMFRAERKAKRVAKIKSKTYRRLARKEAARREGKKETLSLEEMEQLDDIDGGNRAEEMREKMEVDRARERAGLRHSAKNGRFAKVGFAGISGLEEDESRIAERERMQKEHKLKRRVLGKGDESEDESESGSEESDAEADEDAIRENAFDELAAFDLKEAKKAEAAQAKGKKSGLMGMKFMQAGLAREQARADDLEAQFRRELEREDEDDVLDEDGVVGNRVESNIGRMVFAPSAQAASAHHSSTEQTNEVQSSQAPTQRKSAEHKTKLSKGLSIPATQATPLTPVASTSSASANPWLQQEVSGKQARKKNDTTTTSASAEKIANKAAKQQKKSAVEKAKEQDEQEVVIDLDKVLGQPVSTSITVPAKKQKMNKKAKAKAAAAAASQPNAALQSSDEESDAGVGELAASEPALLQRQTTAFQQRDLVARAFANDNVVSEFQETKRREIEADAPQDVDETIPGWGSWGGKGVRKSKNSKKFIKHVPGISAEERKDAGLAHVIINEKRDKKASKYLSKDLPYPYTNATQHEYALRQPLGPEFQTAATHRAHTRPKVLVRVGQIIEPIAKRM
ncbi:U3 small nucleolar RNA-associated 14 [Olea europaea subsp. europaea]|uniref:U3 small nucleolar RNA-associated 14 n=1 Tax=Olea europaea subsp. europaea TaxID=158383 RepID=A0A8S0RDB6_OLEEU|nr:U3 small nucleolar RNA-associated 14 [Olea europaea subsp. europaea]